MVLGKLPVPGRPTNLYYSRARACCACSRCGWGGGLDIFSLIFHFSFLSPSLWETARYRLKYCLKGPLNPTQPTYFSNVQPCTITCTLDAFINTRICRYTCIYITHYITALQAHNVEMAL